MRQLASIAWKEWHELRIFLWIALGVFIGLPIVGGLEEVFASPNRHFGIIASPWVVTLGGVLAVFIAVGASCRDFHGHLEDFWRSRPVGIVRWLVVKYLVGLLIVLASCLLPIGLEYWIDAGRDFSAVEFVPLPFQILAIYSLAFLGGCLVRRTAHAAMLGLAAMLLVYFLPMVLPPLAWMDVTAASANIDWAQRSGNWPTFWNFEHLRYFAGMIGVGIVSLSIAVVSVRLDWHIDSGRKMLYGSVSTALLVLFSSAAFQLGTNLPILQKVNLPNDGRIQQLEFDGRHGFMVLEMPEPNRMVRFMRQTVDLTASGLQIGPAQEINWLWGGRFGVRTQEHPEIEYQFGDGPNAVPTDTHYYLSVSQEGGLIRSMQLPWEFNPDDHSSPSPLLYAWKNRLYVFGARLITLDISDPSSPHVIDNVPFDYGSGRWGWGFNARQSIDIATPKLPDVPPLERLKAALYEGCPFDGEILCDAMDDAICEYRLTNLTETSAEFEKIAQHDSTVLEKLFGGYGNWDIHLSSGLLYVQSANYRLLDPIVTVFDTRGRQPLRLVGHFATGHGGEVVRPLPDGRAIIGGAGKLWLVGPPPRSEQN